MCRCYNSCKNVIIVAIDCAMRICYYVVHNSPSEPWNVLTCCMKDNLLIHGFCYFMCFTVCMIRRSINNIAVYILLWGFNHAWFLGRIRHTHDSEIMDARVILEKKKHYGHYGHFRNYGKLRTFFD